MRLKYYPSTSTVEPEKIDDQSSAYSTYIRKNIVAKTGTSENGETYTYYTYDEAKLTKEQYRQYLSEMPLMDIRQQRADIDYIALMTGIDLGEC